MRNDKPLRKESNGPSATKYVNPLVDFAFKKIFGGEPNKDLLIAFLNEVFRGQKHIADLVTIRMSIPAICRMKEVPYSTCFAPVAIANNSS